MLVTFGPGRPVTVPIENEKPPSTSSSSSGSSVYTPPYIPPPIHLKEVTRSSSSGGNSRYVTTFQPSPSPSGGSSTSTPSTGLSKPIESLVSAMNTPPPVTATPPTVPLIPALGPHFVGWAPWQLIQQWGSAELLRMYLDALKQQEELRNAILEGMAREGLPVTPVPVITEEETKRPIGLRVHFIPM